MKAFRKTTACMLLLLLLLNTAGVKAFAEDIDNCAEITVTASDCGEGWGAEESVSSEADNGCEELQTDDGAEVLQADDGAEVLQADGGSDVLQADGGSDVLQADGGSDVLQADGESEALQTDDEAEVLTEDDGNTVPTESVSSERTDEGKESSAAGSKTDTAPSADSNTKEKETTSVVDNTTSESSDRPDQPGEIQTLSENSSETDTVCNSGSKSSGEGESDSEASPASSEGKETSAGLVLNGEGEFDILVTGTLRSDGTAILLNKDVNPEKVSITVWKIENSSGSEDDTESHIVKEGIMGGDPAVTDKAKKVEAAIKYIIRIEPSQEDIISLSGVGNSHDFPVAREGDNVTLKIAVPDGYKIVGAYNGIGKKVLLRKDEHGDYYVTVPRGGGVYLSAELEKDDDDDDDDADLEVEDLCKYLNKSCNQKQSEDDSECNRIIYDLNGGTLNGDRGPVIVEAESGKEYTLPDAPVKEGARFIRWASSCKDIQVSMPGESFRFTHCVKFTAVWDKDEKTSCRRYHSGDSNQDNDLDDNDDDDTDDDETDDDGPDVTETVHVSTESDDELNFNSIKVDSDPAVGIDITASRDVDVDEDIIVTGGNQGATGITASAEGKTVETEIETGDGMTVKSEGSSVGIEAYASEDGAMSLEFEGDITVSSGS